MNSIYSQVFKVLSCVIDKVPYLICMYMKYDFQEAIITNEKERREARLAGARSNNVWDYRRNPPADWTSPLPSWTNERQESVLAKAQAQKESTGTISPPESESRCVIS